MMYVYKYSKTALLNNEMPLSNEQFLLKQQHKENPYTKYL